MKKIVCLLIIGFIIQLSCKETHGQYVSPEFDKYWSLGISGGPNLFFGDIKQYRIYPVFNYESEWKFAGALNFTRQISPVFGLRGQLLYGNLAGTKREDNKYFEAELLEGNLSGIVNFSNWFSNYRDDRFLNLYGFIGIGFTNYKTRTMYLNTKEPYVERGYEDGAGIVGTKVIGTIPAGLGFDFRLARNVKLDLEFSMRAVNTDYLDNCKKDFAYDFYSYNSLGLKFLLRGKSKSQSVPKSQPQPEFTKSEEKDQQQEAYEPLISQDMKAKDEDKQTMEQEEIQKAVTEEKEQPTVNEKEQLEIEEAVPEDNLFYSVQICAKAEGPLNEEYFRSKYNFNLQIRQNRHNNYYIYTSGRFDTYSEARAFRDELRIKYRIPGVFVVAFEDGNRLNKLP